ncbi:synaptonemal complex protein 1-like [Daphnia pulex]|uniref:synaptonemal complex protein 1-like n=1 Tax=Daphnia pulex TaxID=6669 RepID=UPI001EDE7658|nr:synaptonemal complex protein 1-like [Daphnia pulex]
MIIPDRYCATKPATNDEFSTPSGDDLNQQSCLPLMAKDDDKNQTVLENERLENELSLLQSQLTDSSSKLKMFQNVHDELETTKNELEEKKREISDIKEINLRLTNDDSQFRREIKDRDNLIASSQVELKKFRTSFDEQKLDKVHDQLATINKLAEESAQLADERQVAVDLLQSNITQLKSELTAFESQIDELKKEKSVLLCNASTWDVTEKLLRNEIVHLKSTIGTQNETLSSTMSELERIKQDDSFLKISLESVKATLTEKERENKELTSRNLDLESDKSLLELNNDNLKKETEDCREELERLKQENHKLLDTQEETLSSVQKSTKLAKEQVEALSGALAAMQEATKHTQNAAKATKTERESLNSGTTKTKGEDKEKGNWIKKLIAKRKTREYEDGYANLMETTGLQMVERAKILQDHANNIKAEGKALKKKAKTLPK